MGHMYLDGTVKGIYKNKKLAGGCLSYSAETLTDDCNLPVEISYKTARTNEHYSKVILEDLLCDHRNTSMLLVLHLQGIESDNLGISNVP